MFQCSRGIIERRLAPSSLEHSVVHSVLSPVHSVHSRSFVAHPLTRSTRSIRSLLSLLLTPWPPGHSVQHAPWPPGHSTTHSLHGLSATPFNTIPTGSTTRYAALRSTRSTAFHYLYVTLHSTQYASLRYTTCSLRSATLMVSSLDHPEGPVCSRTIVILTFLGDHFY